MDTQLVGLFGGLGAFLVSAATAYATLRKLKNTQSKDEALLAQGHEQTLFENLRKELDVIRQENSELRGKYESLWKEHARVVADLTRIESEFQQKLIMLESATQQLPLAMWIKDASGRMLWLNDIYESQFLSPRGYSKKDYLGNKDTSVWPDDVASAFSRHDEEVWNTGQMRSYDEPIQGAGGEIIKMRFLKYPYKVGTIKMGTAGITFPLLSEE